MSGWTPGSSSNTKKSKRLWWLKLPKDFFTSNSVIKKMRRLPGGDTYVVITLKLLLLSLDNNFRIYYEGVEDTFPKDIALTIDESFEAVEVTLRLLLQQGWLVQEDPETIYVPKSEEIAGSETPDAKRMRIKRFNNKELALSAPEQCSNNVQDCSENVRLEKEKEKRREEGEKMQEERKQNQPLPELYPEAFISSKQKVIPTLSEVSDYAAKTGIHFVDPGFFFSTFSSSDWMADGKDITDWKTLYIALELDAITAASGVTE